MKTIIHCFKKGLAYQNCPNSAKPAQIVSNQPIPNIFYQCISYDLYGRNLLMVVLVLPPIRNVKSERLSSILELEYNSWFYKY